LSESFVMIALFFVELLAKNDPLPPVQIGLKRFKNDLMKLREIDPKLVPEEVTAQDIVGIDGNFIATENLEIDDKILESIWSDKDAETIEGGYLEYAELFDDMKRTFDEIKNFCKIYV